MKTINNHDYNTITDILYDLYNVTFDEDNCNEYNSIKLHYNPKSGYWVKNFTGKHDIPDNVNAQGLLRLNGIEATAIQAAPTVARKKKKLIFQTCEISVFTEQYFRQKTGATLETLNKYGVLTVSTIGNCAPPLAFCYSSFRTIKIKQPQAESKYKYISQKTESEYIFGFDQLPEFCNTIVLCAGEDDTICTNHHCNKYSIYAVCLFSETSTPSEDLIKELKKRCNTLVSIYDLDTTGENQAAKLFELHDIKPIKLDINWLTAGGVLDSSTKDICEIYKGLGAEIGTFINSEIKEQTTVQAVQVFAPAEITTTNIYEDKKDRFSVGVQNVLECSFRQYLSEKTPFDLIKKSFEDYKRIIIQSSAGTGKSTILGKFAKDFKKQSFNIIAAAPTVAITEQLGIEIKNQYTGSSSTCFCSFGRQTKHDEDEAQAATITVCTFDKLFNLCAGLDLSKTIVVVDEFHQVIQDFGYRTAVMQQVYNIVNKAPNCMLLSATPNLFLCSKILPCFDFKLLKFTPQVTNSINCKIIVHSDKKAGVLSSIEDYKPQSAGGVHCIKLDNNSTLNAFAKQHRTNLSSKNIEHLTSKDASKRENNESYKSIMNNGGADLDKKLDYLIYTSLLEAGCSFKFGVSCVSILDVRSHTKLIQLATRPRMQKDGTNAIINVNLFLSSDADKGEHKSTETAAEILQRMYYKSNAIAKKLNSIDCDVLKGNTASTDIDTFLINTGGVLSVDILKILYTVYEKEQSSATAELIELRTKKLDSRFNFTIEDTTAKNEALNDLLKQAKDETKDSNSKFLELLQSDTYDVLKAIAVHTKNPILKEDIKKVLNIAALDRGTCLQFIEDNAAAFCTALKYQAARDILKLCSTGVELTAAVQVYANKGHKESNRLLDITIQKKRAKAAKIGTINKEDHLQHKIYKAVQSKFDKIRDNAAQGKRPNKFTIKELQSTVNATIQKVQKTATRKTEVQAIDYLKTIYEIEAKRTKKGMIYKLINRI